MRILVVDDHEFTGEGIIRILSDNFDLTKVARVGSYEQAMEQIQNTKWDLLIMDVNLVGKSGLEVITTVRSLNIKTPILVLSMVPVSQYVRRIIQSGATGYITKGEPAEELLKAVRMLTKGMKYFSPEVQQELPQLVDESIEHPKHEELSNREYDILLELANGKNIKDIATELKISVNTVHSYRKRVMAKLHAKTNLDLVLYAYQHGIVR
jgi:two-component system, NarL family, invasion response regulator UvrY